MKCVFAMMIWITFLSVQANASWCGEVLSQRVKKVENLFIAVKNDVTQALLVNQPLSMVVVGKLRERLSRSQQVAINRISENSIAMSEAARPLVAHLPVVQKQLNQLLTKYPEIAASDLSGPASIRIEEKAATKLIAEVNQLSLVEREIENTENRLRSHLQRTHEAVQELQAQIRWIESLQNWLSKKFDLPSDQQPLGLMVLKNELSSQAQFMAKQIEFLKEFYPRFDTAFITVASDLARIRMFFGTQWPQVYFTDFLRTSPKTNFIPRPPSVVIRESAFNRKFTLGDRLIMVWSKDPDRSEKKTNPRFSPATYVLKQDRSGGYPGVFYSGFRHKSRKQMALGTLILREAKSLFHPIDLFIQTDLNENARASARNYGDAYLVYLADPQINIDGLRIGDSMEVDFQKVFASPRAGYFSFLLENQLEYVVDKKISDLKEPPFLNATETYFSRAADQAVQKWQSLLEGQRQRVFAKVMGTNPKRERVLLAVWHADIETGSTSAFTFREIDRADLGFLKKFDDYFMHWPVLERLILGDQSNIENSDIRYND